MRTILMAALILGASLAQGCATHEHDETSGPMVMNTKCPIMDEDVDPAVTTMFEGKMVAFCCKDCIAEWEDKSVEEKRAALAKVSPVGPAAGKPMKRSGHDHGAHNH